MSDISNQLIKNSYDYVLQSDLVTGVVYRIGGAVPVNPIFLSGLTINSGFTYSNGTEQNGYVLTCDPFGNAKWAPVSGATPTSGVTSITAGSGLSGNSTTGAVTIINTAPDQTVTITGGTNIQINGSYPNFGIDFTGTTGGGDYLPLSGGTVTGGTIFQSGLTANTISATSITATNYYGLPVDVFVTGGTYSNGTLYLTNNTGHTFNIPGFSTATGNTNNYYGSFSDTTTQVVNGANTPTAWSANTTEISNGIYIVDGSKITVSNDGIYEIGYSAQIEKTVGGGDAVVTIWAKINGNDVDRSSSTITLPNQSAFQLPFVSYIFDLYAGDYIEFYFSSTVAGTQITTLSSLTSPTRPNSPSLIIVAKAIGNAVLSNSGDSYVTGFTLTNDNLILSQNRVGQYSGFTVNLPYLNTSGGTITGNLNVTGNVSGTTYYGDGSNLTGISRGGGGGAGGQLYYFNISNTQNSYYEFSTTATTATQQSITVTTGSTQTAYIGGFMTPSTLPNITNFPAGILSFYIHAYANAASATFELYCELYSRTTLGVESLLLTTDPTLVAGTSTIMYITDAYFSGATLNTSDRLVVKVYATNTSNQTRSITMLSEGSVHYSFALTTIPTFTDTYVTGFTYSNNTFTIKQNNSQPDLTQTINSVTGWTVNGNLSVTGTTSSGTISATTYQNLPVSAVTSGTGISASTSNGVVTITNTSPNQIVTISGGTGITTGGTYPNFTITNSAPDQTVTISGGTGITTGGTYPNFTLVNSAPDQTVTITGGTNIQINGTYPNFGIDFTGGTILKYYISATTPTGIINNGDRWFNTTDGVELVYVTDGDGPQWVQPNNGGSNTGTTSGGDYLPISGGTVTGDTIFQSGLTATTISATTYYNFPINIVSSSCVVANDGFLYFGNSRAGWSYWDWDTQFYGTSLNYSDSIFGIPIPFDISRDSKISFSGIAYSDAAFKIINDVFEFNVYYFRCNDFRHTLIGNGSGNFDENGIFCFGDDFQLPAVDLYACCSFLLVSFGVTTKESDGSIVKISFKLTT